MAVVLPKMQDFGKATALASVSMDSFNKAMGKLSKAKESASALDAAKKAMGEMTNAEKRAASEAQRAAAKNQAFNDSFSDIGAEVSLLGGVMAAWVAVIGGTVGALVSLAAAAISVTQENAKMLTTFSALAGSASGGKEILAVVDQLSSKLPLPREQIGEIAKTMASAGFRGQALGKAVESVAAATAIMGESGGAAASKMLTTLAEGGKGADKMLKSIREGGAKSNKILQQMGLSVEDLGGMSAVAKMNADQMGQAIEKALAKKGAGPLAEMGQTFPVMLAKLKEGFFSLFEGLGPAVKPFMAAVQSLFGQFTRGKGPMKALGAVATQALGVIFKYATMAVRAVSAFVAKNFTAKNVGKTWDTIKGAIAQVAAALGFVWAQLGPIFTSQSFLDGLAAIFKVIAVVVGVCVAAFAALTAVLGGLAGSVIDLVGMGADLVSGLVNAVTNGIPQFVAAMTSLASQGLAAFKSFFTIGSPSKVMAEMGGYVADGAEIGIDSGAGDVAKSAVRLGQGVTSGFGKGAAGAGGGKSGGKSMSVTVEAGAVVINAGGSTVTDEGLAVALERLLAAQGL